MEKPLVLLGGSFNPPHSGHMRLAIEVAEALSPCDLHFLPSASPPHKSHNNLLPFDLRCELLESACKALKGEYFVNRVEAEREGPSYTSDTLLFLRNEHPGRNLFFVLGAEDYAGLTGWHEWWELPRRANVLVAERQGAQVAKFDMLTRSYWPDAVRSEAKPAWAETAFMLPGGFDIFFMSLPRLDINASLIRRRWLEGRDVHFWLPDAVLHVLDEYAETVSECWNNEPQNAGGEYGY